ncbi:MAG: glycosyltransferase family 1 protein, partial [Opitutae bacterium]
DLMNTLPPKTRFLPYCHVDLNYWCPRKDKGGGNREILRIGHAPSNRQVKGTQEILDVIKQLKINFEERFEFVLIENVDHEDAMRLYDSIDILIDQIYVGWYGGLAVEAMALGKPVLCYIRESDLRFIPQEMAQDLPVINVESNTLLTVLSSMIEMPREQLLELGRRSRSYVEKWHCPTKVVQQLIEGMNLK